MAVIFTDRPSSEYLYIYNPQVFRFSSDAVGLEATTAEIRIGPDSYVVQAGLDGSFYFNAQEALSVYFNFDFTDPNETDENRPNVLSFTDNNLFRSVSIVFNIDGDDQIFNGNYILFAGARDIGATFRGSPDILPLTIHDQIPIYGNDYGELSVWSKNNGIIRAATALGRGVNRLALNHATRLDLWQRTFGIRPVRIGHITNAIRVKYFSRAGCWFYLSAKCNSMTTTQTTDLGRYDVIRGDVERVKSNFTSIGKEAFLIYTLYFEIGPATYPYLQDLLYSPKVYLWLRGKWLGVSVETTELSYSNDGGKSVATIAFRSSEKDTVTVL